MLTREEVDQWCRERGYAMHMRSGDNSALTYSKDFDTFFLSLTVNLLQKTMVLQGFPSMFQLSTGSLSFAHPKFTELFESRMVAMMDAITEANLNPKF
jgi:hypothetical protein